MGSLNSATSDNTTQETTLATIRSVSGDWDNNNVTTVPGLSVFTSSGTFIAPAGCTRCKLTACGAGGGGADKSNGGSVGSGGAGGSIMMLQELSGTGAHFHITIGAYGGGATTNADGSDGGDTLVKLSNTTIMTAEGGTGGTKSNDGVTGTLMGGVGGATSQSYQGSHTSSVFSSTGGRGTTGSSTVDLGSNNTTLGTPAAFFGGASCYGTAQPGMGGLHGTNNTNGAAGGSGCVIVEW